MKDKPTASLLINFRLRIAVLIALAVVAATLLLTVSGPFRQNPVYHDFADQRTLLGEPHLFNVVSNAPFLLIGAIGVAWTLRGATPSWNLRRRIPIHFFVGIGLTAFGSAWYHLDPTDPRLVWDRPPIAMAFMALFAAVIGERISLRAGLLLLCPLMALGLGSVYYWTRTDDLRPYYLVQGYPMLAIPLMLFLFPPRYTRGTDLLFAVLWYVAAKGCEVWDRPIYNALAQTVSGHTIKHLLGAIRCGVLGAANAVVSPAGCGLSDCGVRVYLHGLAVHAMVCWSVFPWARRDSSS